MCETGTGQQAAQLLDSYIIIIIIIYNLYRYPFLLLLVSLNPNSADHQRFSFPCSLILPVYLPFLFTQREESNQMWEDVREGDMLRCRKTNVIRRGGGARRRRTTFSKTTWANKHTCCGDGLLSSFGRLVTTRDKGCVISECNGSRWVRRRVFTAETNACDLCVTPLYTLRKAFGCEPTMLDFGHENRGLHFDSGLGYVCLSTRT
jgi:hypothetical protein